jgi:hypothetical protein
VGVSQLRSPLPAETDVGERLAAVAQKARLAVTLDAIAFSNFRRQARKSINTYDNLLIFLIPIYNTVVFNAVMTFFEEANIWDVEYFCSNLLQRLLMHSDETNRTNSVIEIICE